jgi:transposase-like protein
VDLSTADSNKWLLLIEGRLGGQTPEVHTFSDYELSGPIRQRQRRLTGARVIEMVARYEEGATVYELAAEFGCHRATVAERLKKAGASMRLQSPKSEVADEMVNLYESCHSIRLVAEQLGFCANTVRSSLRKRRIEIRDTQQDG